MEIYDYRKDLIKLIAQTSNSSSDLRKLGLVLKIISNMSLNAQNKLSQEEFEAFLSEMGINSSNILNDSKSQPEDDHEQQIIPEVDNLPDKQPESQLAVGNIAEYTINRLLRGAQLLDNQHQAFSWVNEKTARHWDLHTDDVVTAKLIEYGGDRNVVEITNTDHHGNSLSDGISRFNFGLIEQAGPRLIIHQTADTQEQLRDYNLKYSQYMIPQQVVDSYHLHAGDIADLVWYTNAPHTIKISWVHHQTEKSDSSRQVKKHSDYKTRDANTDIQDDGQLSRLDFDLHQQIVAVIVGDAARAENISQLITEHNGQPKIVDGFKKSHQRDFYAQAISDADIVITIQNYVNHETTGAVMTAIAQSDNDQKTAIAHTNSPLMVERAIYRADHGLQAYESAGSDVDYPTK